MALVLTAAFIGMYYQYGGSFYFFAYCFAAIILLMISIADYRYFIIPDQFTLVLLLTAAAVTGYDLLSKQHLFSPDWLSPLYGAAAGAGLMLALGLFGKLRYKKEAIGFGDVKLFGAIGILTGFPQILIVFLLTIFLAFFHIIYLLLRKRISKEVYLPLGPYLCLGLLLFLAFHRQINGFFSWYMSLLSF
jgi:prepilin signal peptidase PulO-like enzyme (type II secretory pathway)